MAESSHIPSARTKIIEEFLEATKRAYDPSKSLEDRKPELKAYDELITRTEAWILLPILNSLIKPDVLPIWLRKPLLQSLTLLPLRPDGVRGTLEFVFSVHPSSHPSAADAQQPQKSGASITHEAVAVATRLLSTVPATLSPEEWYGGISPQLFSLFDGDAGQDLAKTAAQIVGFGILGRKQIGASGAPGWNVFVQPLIEQINPSLDNAQNSSHEIEGEQTDEIIDLSRDKVLSNRHQLAAALRRLKVLIFSNPSPGLCKRVLKPVILQLWALAALSKPPEVVAERYCTPAEKLLHTYLTLFGKLENIDPIIQNILCRGCAETSDSSWQYQLVDGLGIDVVTSPHSSTGISLVEIEPRAEKLVKLIANSCSIEEISDIFLALLRRWTISMGKQSQPEIRTTTSDKTTSPAVQELAEVSVLQKLMELVPETLVSHFDQLLGIICQVLRGDERAPLGNDVVSVVLSLLNLVVTSTTFQRSDIQPQDLHIIEESLDRIGNSGNDEVSGTARNLALLLKYQDEVETSSNELPSAHSAQQIEDRRTYNLAMNYITGDGGNPPPVVSEGLNMLSNLVLAESSILDISAVTVLMSNLLKDNEDYINLRVIKLFTQLANKHPKSTIQELLDNYLDTQEHSTTDIRLRFGEAIIQVIERLGQTFAGAVAEQTGESLLSIAGRRGYRPKTMAKQAREDKLAKLRKDKAALNNDVDDDNDGLDEDVQMTEADRADNEILAQIVQGWESKRGSEDVRMRASALSIFGAALETNITGMGPDLVSNAVDLCINVLTLERDMEYSILRRAAILVILGFVHALNEAREAGRSLGFGLTDSSREVIQRTLSYVADTDNDGLVQRHARDVAESLKNWQLGSLLPQQDDTTVGLARLAGLSVNPGGSMSQASGKSRPRIEEVE
ncbi:hypothetical protein QQS21_008884 [Conoideocrella luteorostrata]|uniref:RNA polymerase II assembly factor Rtp1 C-terminal domain-containing protein n=1 Tax=Conoideocrella luteorostrata TaxID=1105319 RepID=A0AAJ0FQS4_9HYPO|nr:hypothetical protein QQS21_008884 [Conoideocrella luteorostrata]